MTAPIAIHRTEESMKKQAGFLMKKQFLTNLKKNRYFYILLAVSTLIAALIIINNPTQTPGNLVSGFFFFVAFLWMAAVIFTITALLNYANSIRMTNRSIRYYAANLPESFLSYDNEKMVYITGLEKSEYKWADVTGYMEYQNSLYFVINNKLLESVSFAQTDIGEEHYNLLRSIAISRFS